MHRAVRAGVDRARIVIDPGLGFGKRGEQNSEILARLPELGALDLPILVGPSRKLFLEQGTERETEFATAAAVAAAILAGAHLVRVHDVRGNARRGERRGCDRAQRGLRAALHPGPAITGIYAAERCSTARSRSRLSAWFRAATVRERFCQATSEALL